MYNLNVQECCKIYFIICSGLESSGIDKSPAMKRLAQSHDSLNFHDSIDDIDSASPALRSFGPRSRDDTPAQSDRQQHLGNIDISNSSSRSSQQRSSRSTDSESPSSAKTGKSLTSTYRKNTGIVVYFEVFSCKN